jgi:predicted transport protein
MLLFVASRHLHQLYFVSQDISYIEINQINDPLRKARDAKDIGHYSSGKTEMVIT